MRSKVARTNLSVFLFYFLSALIMTYPLVLHLFSDIAGGWGTRDSLSAVAVINWVKTATFDLHVDFRNFNYILHPYGMDILKEMNFSLDFLLAVPLVLFGGPIFAYNFMFLLELSLSAFAMFLFAGYMTKNKLAALFSGFAFGFFPYHFAHAFAGHFNLFGTWWIPFMLLFLHRAVEDKRTRDSAIAAVFFFLASFTSGYYGAMCAVLVLLAVLFYVSSVIRRDKLSRTIKINLTENEINTALRISIPFLVFSMPLIAFLDYIGPPGKPFHKVDLAIYSASSVDYLTPGSLHPIWRFLGERPWGHGFPWERDLYLGIVMLVLAYLGLTRSRERLRWLYLFVALSFFTLSLGPLFWMDDTPTSIQLPYGLLYDYVPLLRSMRALARFGLIVMLAISILAATGLASILKKCMERPRRGRIIHRGGLVTLLLILVVAFEFASAPFPYINPYEIEGMQAYRWLADQRGDFAIAEYPIDWASPYAMFGTVIHGKRTVCGSVDFPRSEVRGILDRLSFFQPDFSRKVDLDLYRSLNIRYVLFHSSSYVGKFGLDNWYRAIDLANRTEGLRFMGDFGGTLIYEVG